MPDTWNAKWEQADVTVVGCHRAAAGIGEAARQTLRSLAAAGLKAEGFDVSEHGATGHSDESCSTFLRRESSAPLQIFNINACDLPFVFEHHREQLRRGVVRTCIPFWELSNFPAEWVPNLSFMNEVWAPSRFVQAALAPHLKERAVHMPVAIELDPPARVPRTQLGLPEGRFLFFFAFDFLSFIERKNPQATIAAFRQAFPQSGRAGLVLKCVNGEKRPQKLAELIAAIDGHPDIFLVDRALPRSTMMSLMAATDAVVSLHRSEGFGLLVAEAMCLGKPVIATDYSATRDLLSQETGFPVKYRLIEVSAGEYLFPAGQFWADPDIDQAAWLMRRLVDDPVCADAAVANAKTRLRKEHSFRRVGSIIRQRVNQLLSAVR